MDKKSNKIKLLVFKRGYPRETAIVKRINHLFVELVKNNIEIKVISMRDSEILKLEEGEINGIKYVRIGSGLTHKISDFHRIILSLFKYLKLIYKFKNKNTKNVLYSGSTSLGSFIPILFAKLLGYKIIIDIVEDYSRFSEKVKFSYKINFWTSSKLIKFNVIFSNAMVVISTRLYKKYEGLKAKNIKIIPVTAKINSNTDKKITFHNPFSVFYVGTFAGKDGVDLIISGFLEFNKIYSNSKLFLVGKGSEQKKYKRKYANFKNVVFTGFIPDQDYYPLIQKADVLCMCRNNSHFANAGFPFKLGEYLATGKPVIATKVSDVEHYLSNKSAYLIEPDNKKEFIEALRSIKNNPEEAFNIGINGQKVCAKYFDINKNSQLFLDLINNI